MKRIGFVALCLVSALTVGAQTTGSRTLTPQKLGFLKGEWSGTLEIQEDAGQQNGHSTEVTVDFVKKGKKIKYLRAYTDRNGKEVEEKGKIKVSKDGSSVKFGSETFQVSNFVPAPKEDRYRLILTRREASGILYRTSVFLSEGKLMMNHESKEAAEGSEYTSQRRYFLREG
jgi:hypothetical protein